MSMSKKMLALVFGIAVCAGCKQGEGERCQIDNDCEQGLTCNAATQECQVPGSFIPDAAPEDDDDAPAADAATVDAPPVDAPSVDAAPPDAATPDAAPPDAVPMM